jgi:hypothetical protein
MFEPTMIISTEKQIQDALEAFRAKKFKTPEAGSNIL